MSSKQTEHVAKAVVVSPSFQQWRERVLDGVLGGVFIFWLIIGASGINQVIRMTQGDATLLSPVVLVAVYLLAVAVLGFVTLNRHLHTSVRVWAILATIYGLGVLEMLQDGLNGSGRLFFLTFVALTAVLLSFRGSMIALLLSLLSIAALGIAISNNWLALPIQQLDPNDFSIWLKKTLTFALLGSAVALAITYLVRSLDYSLSLSQKERTLASAILDTSGALVVLFTPDGRIVRFNRACELSTGYTAAEIDGQLVWDLFLTPEGVILTRAVFDQLLAGQSPSAYEGYWLTKDGGRRLIAWSCSTILDNNGKVECIIGTGIDITAHKQAEAERERLLFAEREQRLQAETINEVTLSLTSQTNPTDVLDEVLRQAHRVVPYKAAHIALLENGRLRIVRSKGYEQFNSQELINDFAQPLSTFTLDAEAVRTGKPIVVTDTRLEPRWITIEATKWIRSHVVVPIRQQDSVLGLLRLDGDTPREFAPQDAARLLPLANAAAIALENARLHQQTRRQARRVQQILDTVQEGILLLDSQYRIELANPVAQKYLSLLAGAAVGDVLAELGSRPLADLLEPISAGSPWHEIAYGKTRRIFEIAAQPVEGANQTRSWVMVLREVTEIRKQQQFLQAQERLAMVGQLAAGIAHDFNNIMTVIILYAQMLLKTSSTPGDQRVSTIFQQAKLAANLIVQILDFSRQSAMERKTVNLLPFLKEFVKLAKRTFPENISINLDYGEGDFTTSANLTRLQQVIMNLAVNARDAMPEGGKLKIGLEPFSLAAAEKPPLPDMPVGGEWLALSVSDTGTGIKPEDLVRIFEPFFTTKAPGKGTGLGLAQVYGIVKQHDGFIDVTSELGKGTTFTLYLPAVTYQETAESEALTTVTIEGGGQTILVVEDDAIMREAVAAILETLNYKVLMAADGETALELFGQNARKISLVLSDMVMPGISGMVLYERLKQRKPDIKMVIVTGYPFEDKDIAAMSEGVVAWVQKPFELETISAAIQQALSVEG